MNFPNATPAELEQARRIILRAVNRTGLPGQDGLTMHCADAADEVAQSAMLHILTKVYRTQPESIRHAACMVAKAGRLYGWHRYTPGANAARQRAQKGNRSTDAAQAHTIAVAIGRSVTPSPADMAEHAERLRVPVYRIHEANGIGPGALAEPGHTPSVYGSGPATPAPVTGCRGVHLETDPNPDATVAAQMSGPAFRADVDAYRAQLAAYYGTGPALPTTTGRTTRAAQIAAGLIIPAGA